MFRQVGETWIRAKFYKRLLWDHSLTAQLQQNRLAKRKDDIYWVPWTGEKNFQWKVRQSPLCNYCKLINFSSDFDRLPEFKQIRNLSNNFLWHTKCIQIRNSLNYFLSTEVSNVGKAQPLWHVRTGHSWLNTACKKRHPLDMHVIIIYQKQFK
jgi:hypothetical protein